MKKRLAAILGAILLVAGLFLGGLELDKHEHEERLEEDVTDQTPGKDYLPQAGPEDWEWLSEQEKIYELSRSEVNSLLKELNTRFPSQDQRLKALSLLRLGTPHEFDCLGEESGRDQDPLFRLDVADCTSFVLTNVALVHADNLQEAEAIMKDLNYYPGEEISFENRLHFTTERNRFSPYFRNITEGLVGDDKTTEKKVVLNKKGPEGTKLIDIDWEKEVDLEYIPNKYLDEGLLSNFPVALGVAFIKESDAERGLDVAHEGFLFEGEDLIYASSIHKSVVKVDFLDYHFSPDHVKFDGILLFKIK